MKILITGASGKVGRHFIGKILGDRKFAGARLRALCHNRMLEGHERLEVVKGSISERGTVEKAMEGVTHVLHLATCKETPEDVMDVAVKGLFWLLEAARESRTFKQFLMVGGDAAMGHFFYPHPVPVTEGQKHSPYPGCYALSKVLEEVMLDQYYIQYGLEGCCLRAPWIMEKDDFKYSLSFGEDVFGGPRWRDFVTTEEADAYHEAGTIPVMLDPDGVPVQRNFVHVEDLVSAIMSAIDNPKASKQLFNICMDEPIHYGLVAAYLAKEFDLDSVEIPTPYRSTWLDNSKAKFLLGWRPGYDMERLASEAYRYKRPADDPRKVWYPG